MLNNSLIFCTTTISTTTSAVIVVISACSSLPERWSNILADADWKSHTDLKADFPSADFVGNNRYVFNIKGNNYRTVVLVVFFAGTVAIRFVGTHGEYDKIKDIKNI